MSAVRMASQSLATFMSHKNGAYRLQLQKPNGSMLKKVLIVCVLLLRFDGVFAQVEKNHWIDSIFQTLSTRQKIGQLFVVPASSYFKSGEIEDLLEDIEEHQPGGIIITKGGPVGTAGLIKKLQQASPIPLLVLMDAESGPGKTLDSLFKFPNPLSLGAVNDSLLVSLGAEIARQMRLLGANMNLAPNADIDIIPSQANSHYGSDKKSVSRKTISLMDGMRNNGVIAIAKHSSTFGDEDRREAEGEHNIDFINNRLDTLSFYPFHQLIEEGIGALNTSNLHFSTVDKKKTIPASVSQIFISDILKQQLKFEGLAITEIPYFHNLTGKSKVESEKMAFEVGNDLLLYPFNMNASIKKIEVAIKRNASLSRQLDNSVKKILSAKYDVGLAQQQSQNADNLVSRLNSRDAMLLRHKLAEASISIVSNENEFIPLRTLDDKKYASVSIGSGDAREFNQYLTSYTAVDLFTIEQIRDTTDVLGLMNGYDAVVVSTYNIRGSDLNEMIKWINRLTKKQKTILCSFGNPFDLAGLDKTPGFIVGYTDASPVPMITSQIIFGTRQGLGKTPLTIQNLFLHGEGRPNNTINRLSYGIPEQAGMDSKTLDKIDAIVQQALDSGATPGGNILIARKGIVVYNKTFGWKTYEKKEPVTQRTIYDLASITKVAATLQTVMFMHEKNLIDINKKVSVYLPELKGSNKENFTIKDIITHQAGLWPYLPFWLQTMKDSALLPDFYSSRQSDDFPFPVSKDLFASKVMKDSLWQWIIKAKVKEKKPRTPFDYTYSDMGFYILQHLAEKLLNQPIQDFLAQNLYEPIGATTTGFLPFERFAESQIAPTEDDTQFRKSTLVGYVHDQGAAMHGGIAGHAGLFSNANDLAKLGQMWLQKGSYGGLQFYKPETIDLFTAKQYETSRRGLGWDKPTVGDWNGPTSLYASPKTFGHTGFTGTAIWVDPEFDLVFVFLSNRVYPSMFNTKLLTANIRPRIQDVIYESIFEYCKH